MAILFNKSTASIVSGTSDADSIRNVAPHSTISGGDGKDTLINDTETGISLLEDNGLIRYQTIQFSGILSSINGGAGNDVIIDKAGYSTIIGGPGNDTVTLGAHSVFQYADGDGNDVIYNYTSDNTIHVTSGTASAKSTDKDIVVTVGKGKITLKNARGTALNVVDSNGKVTPAYFGEYDRWIVGTNANDTIYNQKSDVTVEGGAGNDVLINNSNYADNSALFGRAGNDSLVSNSRGVILNGGTGDDILELGGLNQIIRYKSGDGNDTVIGYQSTDTLHITDGADYSTSIVGNDVIVKVGKGTITFLNAADKTLNVDQTEFYDDDEPAEWEIATPGNEKISFNKSKGIITVARNFNGLVDAVNFGYSGIAKIDASAVKGNVVLRAGKKAAVLVAGSDDATLEGGPGNDKLYGSKGEDLFIYNVDGSGDVIGNTKDKNSLYQEQDYIVIVGDGIYDLGDVSIKDNKSSVIVSFNGDKKSKLTINRDSVNTPINFYFGSTFEAALETGVVTYGELPDGVHFGTKGKEADYTKLAVDDTVDVGIIDAAAINSQIITVDASNAEEYLEIKGTEKNNVLKGGKGGSVLDGGTGNDQLYGSTDPDVVDSFVFKMQPTGKKDVIYNYNADDEIVIDMSLLEKELPEFDDSTRTITYEGAKANFNGFDDSKSDVVITLNKKNTITVKNASGQAINLVDQDGNALGTFGHVLPDGLKYNDKKTDILVDDAEVASDNNEEILINLTNEDEFENEYFAKTTNVDLTGATVEAVIVGNEKSNILKAGELHTELRGGAGNDQLYGTKTEDSSVDFYYNSGKDVIYNYTFDKDYFYIDGETPLDYEVLEGVTARNFTEKGNDVILTLNAKNSITFKDAVGSIIEIFDENGALNEGEGYLRYDFSLPEGLSYDSAKRTAINVTDSDVLVESGFLNLDLSNETNEEEFLFASTVRKVDLSAIEYDDFDVNIVGNSQANEIYAPNGGTNELYGGHQEAEDGKKVKVSNDTLVGGKGEDVFVYGVGDGKDIVKNYGVDDVIQLDESYDAIESIVIADKKNVVSVTLNGDKNNVLTIEKQNINQPVVFKGWSNEINGRDDWSNVNDEGFVFGVDSEQMTLSADGTKLSIGGDDDDYVYEDDYVYVDAREISTQIKTIDARKATGVEVEIIGNGNSNVIYAGTGGAYLDGGYDAIKMKATNDILNGGAGDDYFIYNFELGLGGKDTIVGFGNGDDVLSFDTAPKSVTTNGKSITFNFEEKIDGKTYKGTLLVNGAKAITSETEIDIEIAGEYNTYKFGDKLKNAAWGSAVITVVGGNDDDEVDIHVGGNTAEQWTQLDEHSFAYNYNGVAFTVSGSAVQDWTPGNSFLGLVPDVISPDGIPDGIIVDTEKKRIILSDQFDTDNATFTFAEGDDASNYEWPRYMILFDGSNQLTADGVEEYWFTPNENTSIDEIGALITEPSVSESATDLAVGSMKEKFDAATLLNVTSTAVPSRRHIKK